MEPLKEEIIIVDDSKTQSEYLRHILEKNGFSVICARDGCNVLRILRTRTKEHDRYPKLIFSDVLMPQMDGYELCIEIKKICKDIPVILVTFLDEPKDIIKGLECGADNFIIKPYDEEYLMSYIKKEWFKLNRENSRRELEFPYDGHTYIIESNRGQAINFLMSTYETVIRKNRKLITARNDLAEVNIQLEDMHVEEECKYFEDQRNLITSAIEDQKRLSDITIQKHALAYEKLRADDNQTIIQGISHELRSPMSGLIGLFHAYRRKFNNIAKIPYDTVTNNCETCKRRLLLSEIFSALDTFQDIVSNLSDILNNLSSYGKNIRQHYSSPQDVRILLASAIKFVRFADSSKKLEYSALQYVDLSEGISAIVNIAPSKFLQIIQNIVENAITAVKETSSRPPKIIISLYVGNKNVIIRIEDNGIGIPKDKIKNCTDLGYTTKKGNENNGGLGLYFVNSYLIENGGNLEISSKEDVGTIMTISLIKCPSSIQCIQNKL
jgi:signal transduction histidine kinase